MKRSKWLLCPMFGVLVMVVLIIILIPSSFTSDCPSDEEQGKKQHEAVVYSPITNYASGKVQTCEMLLKDGKTIKAVIFPSANANAGAKAITDSLHIGDGLILTGTIQQDTSRYARNDIYGIIKLTPDKMKPAVVDLTEVSVIERTKLRLLMTREKLLKVLRQNTGEDEFAIIAAMTLGDRSQLARQKDIRSLFASTGTAHILALSGLHIGIIFAFLTMVIGIGKRKMEHGILPIIRFILIMIAIWGFVMLVGMPISAVRSATMISIYAFISAIGRRQGGYFFEGNLWTSSLLSFNTLCLAGVIILIASPQSLKDVGFQLSFLSVAGILLFHPLLYPILPQRWLQDDANASTNASTSSPTAVKAKLSDKFWTMTVISLSAQIATAPLVAYYFSSISTLFLLSNYVVIPLATLILYGTIVFFTVSFLPAVQAIMGVILTFLTDLMVGFLRWVADIPFATISGISIDWIEVAFLYLIIIYFFRWWNRNTANNLKILLTIIIIFLIKLQIS